MSHLPYALRPVECHIEKVQKIVSGLGPSATIVPAVTVGGGSQEATCGFDIDAFIDFRQLDLH